MFRKKRFEIYAGGILDRSKFSLSHLHATEELARHPLQAGVGGGPDDALGPPGRGPGQQPQQRVGDDVAGDAPVHPHVPLDVSGADSGVNLDIKMVTK